MIRANHLMTSAGLSLAALLTACGSPSTEDVLELHCRGEEVVDAQPAKHSVSRTYRFDLNASALENWDPHTGRFVRWGAGRVSNDKGSVAYVGEIRSINEKTQVKREIEFNRSTRRIHDLVEGSWGSVAGFTGTCEEH